MEVTDVDDVGGPARGARLIERCRLERIGEIAPEVPEIRMTEGAVGAEEVFLEARDRLALPGEDAPGAAEARGQA